MFFLNKTLYWVLAKKKIRKCGKIYNTGNFGNGSVIISGHNLLSRFEATLPGMINEKCRLLNEFYLNKVEGIRQY